MSSLKPYPTYYPIRYDYVSQLPEGWKLLPNIAIFQERIERGFINEELLSVTIKRGIIPQSDIEVKKDGSNEDKGKYKLIKPGDIAYNKMRMWQGAVGKSEYRGICSPAYVVLKPKAEINPKFFHYMFRTNLYTNYNRRFSYGIVDDQLSLRYGDFKRMYSIFPPLNTQNAIVAYLDRKTKQIQEFIQKKERLIELLEEEKQTIIDECISNGFSKGKKLNLVQWRKETPPSPSHWKSTRIKYLFSILNGYAFSTSSFESDGVQVLKIGNLYKNKLSLERQPTFVSENFINKLSQFVVKKNDILMSLTGTLGKEDYGFAVLLEKDEKFLLNQRVAKLIPNSNLDNKYALYLLRSRVFLNQLYLKPSGTKQANLSNDDILSLHIAIPEIEEQQKNIVRLESEINKLDKGVSKATTEIEKAKEYQESLITQVVTGQLKVPELKKEALTL